MTTHHTAQGLASLGRHGDTMLVHMSPHEVAGLNYLAKKQGTKLTVNPDTGLPEAFSLGGFFSSFLPTIAGMAFAPETGGFSMYPLLAGAATGAGLAAIKGENPLMGGLMGGLGGYGGGQLGYSLGKAAGANAPVQGLEGTLAKIGGEGASNALGTNVLQYQAPGMGGLGFAAPSSLPEINAQNIITAAGQGAGSGSSGASAFNPMEKLSQAFSGAKNISGMGDMAQADAWKAFTGAGGTGTQLAMPVGGALLGGLEPSDLYGKPMKPDNRGKYDPYATLNLGNDTGLRLVAKGGYIDGYAQGGTIASGGIRDLYGRNDDQLGTPLSRDGYGIGRLDQLANAEAMNTAKTLGYAMGGPVSFADGGQADADAMNLNVQPTLNLESGKSNYILPSDMNANQFVAYGGLRNAIANQARQGVNDAKVLNWMFGLGSKGNTIYDQFANQARSRLATGGEVHFADGGDANKEALGLAPIDQTMGIASLTPSATTPTTPGQTMPSSQVQNMASALSGPTSSDNSIITKVANDLRADPNYQPTNPIEAAIAKQIRGTDQTQQSQGLGSLGAQPSQPMAPTYNPSVAMGPTYYAGMNAPRGFADGGDVDAGGGGSHLNLENIPALHLGTPSGNVNGLSYMTSDGNGMYAGRFFKDLVRANPDSPGLFKLFSRLPDNMVWHKQMAKGGYLDGQGDGMNLDRLPSLNVNTGEQIPVGSGDVYHSDLYNKFFAQYGDKLNTPLMANAAGIKSFGDFLDRARPQMAKGGYLNGDGDGMSDSIPATIEGKQPARLADGEFVVPADVVSHIGNGSSKAGSKRLYSMLDRVRKARTGHTKQGKQIKPEKYMPA